MELVKIAKQHGLKTYGYYVWELFNPEWAKDMGVYDKVICPHTATGYSVRQKLSSEPWIIASTAHPSKFESVVEPLLKMNVPMPASLTAMMARENKTVSIAPHMEDFKKVTSLNVR